MVPAPANKRPSMTELERKTEVEVEDFGDELSDEALDREQGGAKASTGAWSMPQF
jgi:hypothetical protein